MEHACEKCGAPVEDGVPFCPSCNAPQIRVTIAPDRAVTPPLPPGTPGEIQPPAVRVPPYFRPGKVQWRLAMPGAALAGFLLAMSMLIPFVSPFILMLLAGGLAAALYSHRSPTPITAGQGARVGAVSGLFGFGVLATLTLVQVAVAGKRVLALLQQALAEQLARNPDPRVQEVLDRFATPQGLVTILIIGSVIFLGVVLASCSVGGAIAGALLGRRRRNIG